MTIEELTDKIMKTELVGPFLARDLAIALIPMLYEQTTVISFISPILADTISDVLRVGKRSHPEIARFFNVEEDVVDRIAEVMEKKQ